MHINTCKTDSGVYALRMIMGQSSQLAPVIKTWIHFANIEAKLGPTAISIIVKIIMDLAMRAGRHRRWSLAHRPEEC